MDDPDILLKKIWYISLIFILGFYTIFMGIYAWSFPEKTDRQIILDLFSGKFVRYFTN